MSGRYTKMSYILDNPRNADGFTTANTTKQVRHEECAKRGTLPIGDSLVDAEVRDTGVYDTNGHMFTQTT